MFTEGDFAKAKDNSRGGVTSEVKDFIISNFLFKSGSIGEEDSLIGAGVIDSTGVVELVAFLEQRFGITIGDEELVPENLDSIARIAAYVAGKKGH